MALVVRWWGVVAKHLGCGMADEGRAKSPTAAVSDPQGSVPTAWMRAER